MVGSDRPADRRARCQDLLRDPARTDQIRTLIDRGMFADVYVPAFHAKDLALALAERGKALPPDRRRVADPAISKLVRSAYLLDAFGDLGNKQQISAAFMRAEFRSRRAKNEGARCEVRGTRATAARRIASNLGSRTSDLMS